MVFDGCRAPLIGGACLGAWAGHGADGLGGERAAIAALLGANRTEEEAAVPVPTTAAAVRLVEVVREQPGLTVLALGPLTNLAVALLLDEEWATRVSRLVVMVGK